MNDVTVPAVPAAAPEKPSRRRRHAAITAALVIGSFGASVAVAQWTSTGTGPSEARSLTAVALTVNARTATADLYPGFAGGDVYFSVTNPNPYGVTLTSATFGAVTSANEGACAATNVTTNGPKTGLSLVVGPGATEALTIADAVSMGLGADNGCQTKVFTVSLTLSGAQS